MDTPSSPVPTAAPSAAPTRPKPWLLIGCAGFAGLVVVVLATVAITLWWLQRPIQPVDLAPPEWKVLQDKLARLSPEQAPRGTTSSPAESPAGQSPPTIADDSGRPPVEVDRPYTPGQRVLKISERELNGLIHKNTDLGENLRVELGKDAINAYLAVPIPEDFPIGGGRIFRARGRFLVSVGNAGPPTAILEDITVFGLSLPKAWLGGLKGENLLKDAMGNANNGRPLVDGIKSLRVEPGGLVLEVTE